MQFVSTRGAAPPLGLSAALERGLAADGGLLVPAVMPAADLAACRAATDLPQLAARLLAPFFTGDPLEPELAAICRTALSFPIPLVRSERSGLHVLELYWGPTAAFKDVGARLLAECLVRTPGPRRSVWVATSGDTGGAVAAAFWRKPNIDVVILFPVEGVAPRQRHQLTCWGDNVRAFAVRGAFDDCQRILKAALADPDRQRAERLTTANSINLLRLLAQTVYYATASLEYERAHGAAPTFVVPSGNLGNATAAVWAKRMGLPIRGVVLAHNANATVPEFLSSGRWRPRPSVRTLANAMDVGDPSNMERLRWLCGDLATLRAEVTAVAVDDAAIGAAITSGVHRHGRVLDPHTATAVHVVDGGGIADPIVVATAHPAKFPEVVEPRIGRSVEIPPALAALLQRPTHAVEIEPSLDALTRALR